MGPADVSPTSLAVGETVGKGKWVVITGGSFGERENGFQGASTVGLEFDPEKLDAGVGRGEGRGVDPGGWFELLAAKDGIEPVDGILERLIPDIGGDDAGADGEYWLSLAYERKLLLLTRCSSVKSMAPPACLINNSFGKVGRLVKGSPGDAGTVGAAPHLDDLKTRDWLK
jgi:hypothetical protein